MSLRDRLHSLARAIKQEARFYRLVARHPRTPRLARWLLAGAVAYALMPFDLVPDWIPVLGMIDDLVLLPLAVFVALKMVPTDVYKECREQSEAKEDVTVSQKRVELEIRGMSCAHCVATVKRALESVSGVSQATVDLDSQWALVSADNYVRDEDLVKAVEGAGYQARVASMSR